MRKNHRFLNGERGTHPTISGRALVRKSYVRLNLLSTKNARELPKCSKSLHFREDEASSAGICRTEEKENIRPGNSHLLAGFTVEKDGISVVVSDFFGCLP
jgi:hypothetical protein